MRGALKIRIFSYAKRLGDDSPNVAERPTRDGRFTSERTLSGHSTRAAMLKPQSVATTSGFTIFTRCIVAIRLVLHCTIIAKADASAKATSGRW